MALPAGRSATLDNLMSAALGEGLLRLRRTRVRIPPPPRAVRLHFTCRSERCWRCTHTSEDTQNTKRHRAVSQVATSVLRADNSCGRPFPQERPQNQGGADVLVPPDLFSRAEHVLNAGCCHLELSQPVHHRVPCQLVIARWRPGRRKDDVEVTSGAGQVQQTTPASHLWSRANTRPSKRSSTRIRASMSVSTAGPRLSAFLPGVTSMSCGLTSPRGVRTRHLT